MIIASREGLASAQRRSIRWEDQTCVTSVPVFFFGDEPCHHIWQAPASAERSVYVHTLNS